MSKQQQLTKDEQHRLFQEFMEAVTESGHIVIRDTKDNHATPVELASRVLEYLQAGFEQGNQLVIEDKQTGEETVVTGSWESAPSRGQKV